MITDTEQVLTNVLEACFEAGLSTCAIWENSTDLIRARVSNAIDSVHRAPIYVYGNLTNPDTDESQFDFMVVDYPWVTTVLADFLYTPYTSAQVFAAGIIEIEQGEALLFTADQGLEANDAVENLFSCDSGFPQPFSTGGLEILVAIGCGDVTDPIATGLDESIPIYENMSQTSPFFGPVFFAETSGLCSYVLASSLTFRSIADILSALGISVRMTLSMARLSKIRASP